MSKQVLDCSPLVMSLVEVRFTDLPQAKLEEGMESFKTALFELDFSIFNEENLNEFELKPLESGQVTVKQHLNKRWDFINLKRNASVTLTKNQLMYRTTDYKTFEQFKCEWEKVLIAYFSKFPLADKAGFKRVGLRYMDLFMAESDENVHSYISPEFLSEKQLQSDSKTLNSIKRLIQTESGVLKLEIDERLPWEGKVSIFPADVSDPESVALKVPLRAHWKDYSGNRYAVIDIDHFWQSENELPPITAERVLSKLQILYKDSSGVFWSLLTDHAKDKWKVRELKK